MGGLLWLLLFAGLFFVMMRFGCGAHIMHGSHGGHGEAEDGGRDPVCGMPAEAGKGYTKSHAGVRYWFCSKTCLDKFEADPQKYLSAAPGEDTT